MFLSKLCQRCLNKFSCPHRLVWLSQSFAFPPLLFSAKPTLVPAAQLPFMEAAGRMASCCHVQYQSHLGCSEGPDWGSAFCLQAPWSLWSCWSQLPQTRHLSSSSNSYLVIAQARDYQVRLLWSMQRAHPKACLPDQSQAPSHQTHSQMKSIQLSASRKAQTQCNTTLFVCESHLLHYRAPLIAVSLCRKQTPCCPAVSSLPAWEHIRAIVSITFEAGRSWLWFMHIFVMKCSWQVHSAFILGAILHLVYFTCQLKCKQSVYILYITTHCHHVCLWSMGLSWIQSQKPCRAPQLSQLTCCMTQMEKTHLVGPAHCGYMAWVCYWCCADLQSPCNSLCWEACYYHLLKKSVILAESRCDLYGQSLTTENN